MTRSGSRRTQVVVVGGGIAGLAAAHRLKGHADVVFVEKAEHPGGKFATTKVDGVRFESGPDSFVAREPHVEKLAAAVGLGDELIPPTLFGAHIWSDGKLWRAPADFVFGMPTSPLAALRSGLLGPKGAARAAADLVLPGPLVGPDISIGDFVRRRFGSEVLDRLVDPLLAGTRAGRASDISLAAAVPQIDGLARRHRSVTVGLARAKKAGMKVGGSPPFLAPRSGMNSLIEALVDDLASPRSRRADTATETVEIRTSAIARRIERRDDGYRVQLQGDSSIDGNALLLAVPAFVASDLLGELNPLAAGELAGIDYASVATACFIWPPGSVDVPRDASGLLVPSREGRTLAAATWFSQKWAHLAPPDGRIVVKAFAGRAAGDAEAGLSDDRLLTALLDDLTDAIDVSARPLGAHITRWPRALPQYAVGHLDRIERIEGALRSTPGILVAGAAYGGTGISDTVKSAQAAADRIVHSAALP
ncbi:MAG: protoporphyrinogen oxidase [Actinomycetota bacterium]